MLKVGHGDTCLRCPQGPYVMVSIVASKVVEADHHTTCLILMGAPRIFFFAPMCLAWTFARLHEEAFLEVQLLMDYAADEAVA